MKYVLYKIKEGKLDQWNDWYLKLTTIHKEEALKTLEEENITLEAFITFEIDNNFYTLGFNITKKGGAKSSNKENPLNIEHNKNKKECLEFLSRGNDINIINNLI